MSFLQTFLNGHIVVFTRTCIRGAPQRRAAPANRFQQSKKRHYSDNDSVHEARCPRRSSDDGVKEPRAPRRSDDDGANEPRAPRRSGDDGAHEPRAPRRSGDDGAHEHRAPRRSDDDGAHEHRAPPRSDDDGAIEHRAPRRNGCVSVSHARLLKSRHPLPVLQGYPISSHATILGKQRRSSRRAGIGGLVSTQVENRTPHKTTAADRIIPIFRIKMTIRGDYEEREEREAGMGTCFPSALRVLRVLRSHLIAKRWYRTKRKHRLGGDWFAGRMGPSSPHPFVPSCLRVRLYRFTAGGVRAARGGFWRGSLRGDRRGLRGRLWRR